MWLFAVGMSIAVIGSVAGDFFVKKGSAEIQGDNLVTFGGVQKLFNPIQLYQFLKQLGIFKNWQLWLGITLLTFFFAGYVLAMQQAEVTFVVPLMATTYIIKTALAKFFLHEPISLLRWAGISIIVLGITILVGFS